MATNISVLTKIYVFDQISYFWPMLLPLIKILVFLILIFFFKFFILEQKCPYIYFTFYSRINAGALFAAAGVFQLLFRHRSGTWIQIPLSVFKPTLQDWLQFAHIFETKKIKLIFFQQFQFCNQNFIFLIKILIFEDNFDRNFTFLTKISFFPGYKKSISIQVFLIIETNILINFCSKVYNDAILRKLLFGIPTFKRHFRQ